MSLFSYFAEVVGDGTGGTVQAVSKSFLNWAPCTVSKLNISLISWSKTWYLPFVSQTKPWTNLLKLPRLMHQHKKSPFFFFFSFFFSLKPKAWFWSCRVKQPTPYILHRLTYATKPWRNFYHLYPAWNKSLSTFLRSRTSKHYFWNAVRGDHLNGSDTVNFYNQKGTIGNPPVWKHNWTSNHCKVCENCYNI